MKFHLLRKSDLSPVNYKRVAAADGKEVPWDEIVKGYEHEKGKFIVLNDEDFARVDIEATQTVDITDFVTQEEVDPMYFYKPYYMEPTKGGEKVVQPAARGAEGLRRKSASPRWSSRPGNIWRPSSRRSAASCWS